MQPLNEQDSRIMEVMKKALLSLVLLGGALALSLPAQAPKNPLDGKYLHHVFFWLKEPDSAAARKEFLAALKTMQAIPTIRHSYIGTPAGIQRDVVDNSWTYYWLVTFDDKAGWQVYNDHPIHEAFRKKEALWKKVLVYDIVQQK